MNAVWVCLYLLIGLAILLVTMITIVAKMCKEDNEAPEEAMRYIFEDCKLVDILCLVLLVFIWPFVLAVAALMVVCKLMYASYKKIIITCVTKIINKGNEEKKDYVWK